MFDKDDQEISQIIDASIDAVLSGRATLQQVLAEHPQHADALRREIEAAQWLNARREVVASRPGFVMSSRKRVIERIKQEASGTSAKRSIFGFLWPQKIAYQWVAALLALIILFSGAGGVVSYAQGALPGESLYPLKLATERIQYTLTAGELERVEVKANFTNRRLQEVVTMVQQGHVDALEETIQTFEEQVTETVVLLEESSDQQPHEKKVLAVTLQETFTEQAGKLDTLVEQAPAEVQPRLEHARTVTELSASAAFNEASRIVDPTETPTPTTTVTPTGTATATPTVPDTATPVPSGTDTPVPPVGDTEPVDGTDEGAETSAPEEPTVIDNKPTAKPTNPNRPTARPTNPNRPTDPVNENQGVQPTEKPPNPNKPTDKPPNPNKPTDPVNENKGNNPTKEN